MNTQKIEITVFQALTLRLEKYRDAPNKYKQIESIYLTGIRCTRDDWMLNNLLEDPLLDTYSIKTTKHAINTDPVRRYFESHLCHNTLATSLDFLDIDLLKKHYKSIFNRIEEDAQDMMEPIIDGRIPPTKISEYSDGIIKLNKSDSYSSLRPKHSSEKATPEDILNNRKQKLKLIVQCMFAAIYVPEVMPSGITPLNIYFNSHSVYHESKRGRKSRIDADRFADGHRSSIHQTVRPHTLGIMRSFMPLPAEDALLDNEPSSFVRAADYFTYAKGSYRIPDQIFSNKVTPFVASISGTMLVKLRVMAQLLRESQLVYDNHAEQLELFIKTFIAYMIHYAGGHSLDEYLQVLELDVVQREFRHLKGFSNLTLTHLFQTNNTEAFNTSINQTIAYNTHILGKKALHLELEIQHNPTHLPLPSSYIGTVSLNRPGIHTSYTVQDSSILGGALLFGLIRLLDNTSVPMRTKNSFFHHIKQLCYAFCLVTVAHAFGATILKQENKQKNTGTSKTILNNFISATTKELLDYSIFKTPEERIPNNVIASTPNPN
ncbi:MAG: hypothetical protein P1U36_01910 [Legionellaceae bacterium]|nr:hypothetical protein [Legionellaceae bacterium]